MKITWKERLTGQIAAPPAAHVGSWSGMTEAHWQSSNDHINYARDLFTQPKFRDLLSVLSNSRPRPINRGITETEASIMLGIYQGYDALLGLLLRLPQYPQPVAEEVPATYGAEEFDINKQI